MQRKQPTTLAECNAGLKRNRCYYMNAPCSWQPVTGEGHLIAQVV